MANFIEIQECVFNPNLNDKPYISFDNLVARIHHIISVENIYDICYNKDSEIITINVKNPNTVTFKVKKEKEYHTHTLKQYREIFETKEEAQNRYKELLQKLVG